MKQILRYFKPFDYIFIILAILISFLPNIITSAHFNQQADASPVVIVKIGGEVVAQYPLQENAEPIIETFYPNSGQYNIIEVADGRARIKEDNSPDQIGVRTGWISKVGQTAICLPHGLILEVTGQSSEEDTLILPL